MLSSFLLALFLSCLYLFLAEASSKISKEKSSAYECGFDPYKSARLPFSFRFFLLAILFIIFDVEIALLFPFLLSPPSTYAGCALVYFIVILTLGLFHEWRQGVLDWVK